MGPRVALKVDVDTDRGTRVGVPALAELLRARQVQATFLFSLGPDNTGRAIKRIFRPGFFGKVSRTNVVEMYGVRTLLNGVLWPGPHIGHRNAPVLRAVAAMGHEVGVHCYDHIRWQDGLKDMSPTEVAFELGRALREFERIFGRPAFTAGAAGWQANAVSLAAYDESGLRYASDARGRGPFLPSVGDRVFRTPQFPTTLPTLDELLGRPEYPEPTLAAYYEELIMAGSEHVLTVHAEIEGMGRRDWFAGLLARLQGRGVVFEPLAAMAERALRVPLPVCAFIQGSVPGRSGTLAVQGGPVAIGQSDGRVTPQLR